MEQKKNFSSKRNIANNRQFLLLSNAIPKSICNDKNQPKILKGFQNAQFNEKWKQNFGERWWFSALEVVSPSFFKQFHIVHAFGSHHTKGEPWDSLMKAVTQSF